jgi:signal transduction histidine kinase
MHMDAGLAVRMSPSGYGTASRRRREAFLRLARRSAAESDPVQVMRTLLREAEHLHGASGGSVGRWDEERQVLVEFVSTIPGIAAGQLVSPGEGATGQVIVLRAPVIVNDYQRYESATPQSLEADVQAVLAAPLLHEGRLLGVMVIVSDQPGKRFTSENADTLVMMGGIAASTLVALERNRIEERLRLQQRMLARLEERESIAMDLHDNTMQVLHGAVLGLAAAERAADADLDQLRGSLALIRGQLNDAIQELRNYLFGLHPPGAARRRLAAGLAALAEHARIDARIRAEVEIDETIEERVGADQIVQLLAIASEATFNALRHAQATAVVLRLCREAGRPILVIADDGRGFDPHAPTRAEGRGLANIAERARLIGARLTITSRAGSGTEVRVELPLGEGPPRE